MAEVDALERKLLAVVALSDVEAATPAIAPDRELWVTDDGTPLAPALVAAFESKGLRAKVVAAAAKPRGTGAASVGGLICLAAPNTADGFSADGPRRSSSAECSASASTQPASIRATV